MNKLPVRLALSAALSFALPAFAQRVVAPQLGAQTGMRGAPAIGGALAPGLALPGLGAVPLLSAAALTPALPAPAVLPALAPVAAPALAAPAFAAPAAAPLPVSAHAARVAPALEAAEAEAAGKHGRGRDGRRDGGSLFDGSSARSVAPAAYIVNDEGVKINGRAANYYQEVRRMVEEYRGKINLEESLDVMDDAYADVLAKVSAVEAVARGRGLSKENTHLEETLVWVDGLLTDGERRVAVHTHRVFFHKAKNPRSEIEEGIRRVDGYLRDAEAMFRKGGKAEAQMGRLDEVELVFDARGYQEIKDHLRARGAEIAQRTGGRISFKFLDELAPLPSETAAVRARLNELARIYNGDGLSKIYEGVIYSRYVGLLLELKTIEHYHKLGWTILQSGKELFDAEGKYVTELDVVARSPEGKVALIEAKSARVSLPAQEVLEDKVVYKLRTYQKHRAALEEMIGAKIDMVVFSMDAAVDPRMAAGSDQALTEKDLRRLELIEFLKAQESMLASRFGFPTSFLFLQSGPAGSAGRAPGRGFGLKPSPKRRR